MKHTARQRAGIAAVAALVITAGIGINSLTASGSVQTGNITVPYGTLTVQFTDRAGTITLDRLADGATFTQPIITSQPCATLQLGGLEDGAGNPLSGSLLTFSGHVSSGTPSIQLPGSGLGVHDGSNCGGPAGLVGPGEKLTLALGSFADLTTDEVTVGSASLVIGKSHPQDGSLKLAFDSGNLGPNIGVSNGGATIQVGTAFDHSLTLASTASQNSRGLSLRGPTVFNLVAPFGFEQAIDCGDTADATIVDDGIAASEAAFVRSETNGKSDAACDDAGVTLQINDDGVFFDNGNLGVNDQTFQDVTGYLQIDWSAVAPDEDERLDRRINFFPDAGDDDEDYMPVVWCLGFDGTGTPIHPETADPDFSVFNGVIPWCLVSDDRELDPVTGEIFQVQRYHGSGDPSWK